LLKNNYSGVNPDEGVINEGNADGEIEQSNIDYSLTKCNELYKTSQNYINDDHDFTIKNSIDIKVEDDIQIEVEIQCKMILTFHLLKITARSRQRKNFSRNRKHEIVHLNLKKYPCSFCNRSFFQLCHRREHERTQHKAEKDKELFPCALCPMICSTKYVLKRHIFRKHRQEEK
jgi:hypothetical protein